MIDIKYMLEDGASDFVKKYREDAGWDQIRHSALKVPSCRKVC